MESIFNTFKPFSVLYGHDFFIVQHLNFLAFAAENRRLQTVYDLSSPLKWKSLYRRNYLHVEVYVWSKTPGFHALMSFASDRIYLFR